ncbi:flagellar hook-basal body protein [Desulfosporosinus acidiphilus SJ4]|uniref:Flagellar hook protein FlgE n=1 Tax=Desulfosporosinus acidiphilus (strain DSM 22704 / JCM 16185 / SJ4) TaxID=646529 RepID=I4DA59_DESAJ|nr:flagellar hook-basal body complex protein [Desulfosporosinus acidiphilus]AFM42683.1 flagellar hook-basal body protein [Desulfosporosinus acidiphilus SJ4]
MMRSLYSAISGLKAHQTKMDVIGNNIANVNTTGFKRSSVTFATALSQSIRGAGTPTPASGTAPSSTGGDTGGTNPIQIGLGTSVGAINQIMTQGSNETTGVPTDMMIQGNGFFALQDGNQVVYTRSGAFSFDAQGYLVDPSTGAYVLDASSTVPQGSTTASPKYIQVPTGDTYSIDATGKVTAYKDGAVDSSAGGNIGIALFANPAGLTSIGNNYYLPSNNSGDSGATTPDNPTLYGIGATSNYPTGTSLVTGSLEMSNVDLSQEMTDMITAQRGFQANSRVITVSDTLLQELIDLKRS